ncbi:hypothetical protein G3I13_05865 [Streptomyces sp. SID6673]|nr:hypothetical protein [Streptomyces sp. SID11726]NEB23853.1 hypothetical protein [Streptomyces sp. SID6673]
MNRLTVDVTQQPAASMPGSPGWRRSWGRISLMIPSSQRTSTTSRSTVKALRISTGELTDGLVEDSERVRSGDR